MTEKELKLHSANKNAAEFIEVVKDNICDWISYHNVYVPSRDKIQVLSVTFEEDEPSVALALLIDKDSKFDGYKFSIHLNDYRGRGVHVDVFNLRNSKVTNNWDGMTYLGFDKKGYSYEVDDSAYELLKSAGLSNQEKITRFCQKSIKDWKCNLCHRMEDQSNFINTINNGLKLTKWVRFVE